jgi:hypothetical protein
VRRVFLLALVALLAGCGGGDDDARESAPPPASTTLLSELSFAQVVAAELQEGTQVAAEATGPLEVHLQQGLNSLELSLAEDFDEYRAGPERRDEIVAAAAADGRELLERGVSEADFTDVERELMPLLKPPFALRRLPAKPLSRPFAGNLRVVYGVDAPDSFTLVTPADAERWGVSVAEVDRTAQANLVRNTEKLLCEEQLCGWASGDGYDATRLISSKLRDDIAGEIGPAVYAVPREDVFVALPRRLADRIRQRVLQQFTQAEQPISRDLFVERDGKVVVLPPQ